MARDRPCESVHVAREISNSLHPWRRGIAPALHVPYCADNSGPSMAVLLRFDGGSRHQRPDTPPASWQLGLIWLNFFGHFLVFARCYSRTEGGRVPRVSLAPKNSLERMQRNLLQHFSFVMDAVKHERCSTHAMEVSGGVGLRPLIHASSCGRVRAVPQARVGG